MVLTERGEVFACELSDASLGNLRDHLGDTTVLMVASRPAAIAVAESVVFLVGGEVAAHAPHAELMATQPDYRKLVEAFEADRAGSGATA